MAAKYTKYNKFNRYKKTTATTPPQRIGRSWKPSKQQEAIFDAVANTTDNLVVEAGAGCGKTSTMVESVQPLAGKGDVCLLAFNKSIADELQTKVPESITAKTIHALGLACCKANVNKVSIDKSGRKVEDAINELFPKTDFPTLPNEDSQGHRARYWAFVSGLKKFVALSKNSGYRNVDDEALGLIASTYDIPLQVNQELVHQVNSVLDNNYNNVNFINFDDMIWQPVVRGWSLPKYDFVGVDESQDLNKLRQDFVMKIGQRTAVIGDTHQAIYGFTGADVESIATMTRNLQGRGPTQVLKLNITRRCPKAHVELANEIYPDSLQAAPEAPEGTVGKSKLADLCNNLIARDFVLCRTNAPLIWTALQMVRNHKPVVILGRDFCESLKKVIKSCGGETQTAYLTNLKAWYYEQLAKNEGDAPRFARMRDLIEDKYQSIVSVSGECDSANAACAKLDSLFGEEAIPNAAVLSTIHKAKGLEAERVFIMHPHQLPHPMAKAAWEKVQENNLKYVAVTRSKSHLEWVEGDYKELRKDK